jgi:hypothetical protein
MSTRLFTNGNWISGNGALDGIFVNNSNNVGIGTNIPADRLHVAGDLRTNGRGQFLLDNDNTSGVYIQNRSVAYGVPGGRLGLAVDASSNTSEFKYAVCGVSGGTAGAKYGVYGSASGAGGTNYGVYGVVSSGATNNYAVYGSAPNAANTYSGYFTGAMVYVQNQLSVGTLAPDQALTVIGNASKSAGGTTWAIFSDARLKTDVTPFEPGIEELMHLRTVNYRYAPGNARGLPSERMEVGFIAQEVQQVLPMAVSVADDGYLQLNADPILWTAVNAIQDQQGMIDELRQQVRGLTAAGVGYATTQQVQGLDARISSLQAENAELRARLAQQESRIAALERSFTRR